MGDKPHFRAYCRSFLSTMRYRALPASRRAMASFAWLIGRCSVIGSMLWRAEKSNMAITVAGAPEGLELIDFCPKSSEGVEVLISGRIPTVWNRPLGANAPR